MLSASSGACVLTTHADTPPVSKTAVGTDFLKPLDIITEFRIKVLGKYLGVFSSLEVFLPVQEPQWDFELLRICNDGHKFLDFISREFSSTFVDIYFGFFANKISETAS